MRMPKLSILKFNCNNILIYFCRCEKIPKRACKTTYKNDCQKNKKCKTVYEEKCKAIPKKFCSNVKVCEILILYRCGEKSRNYSSLHNLFL